MDSELIEKNLALAMDISKYSPSRSEKEASPKTPPRPKIKHSSTLEEWIAISPSTPKTPEDLNIKNSNTIFDAMHISSNESKSIFGDPSPKRNFESKTKSKHNQQKSMKIEKKFLNDWLNDLGIVIESNTKSFFIRKMQKEKLLNHSFTKIPDPSDIDTKTNQPKQKNIYSAKEFLSILDYSTSQIRILNGIIYFNSTEKVLEENCIYCKYIEDVYDEKLETFRREHIC